MGRLEKTFKALANSKRLKLLDLLQKKGELTVKELARLSSFPYKTVTRHLSRLETADLIKKARSGQFVKSNIPKRINKLIKVLKELYYRK